MKKKEREKFEELSSFSNIILLLHSSVNSIVISTFVKTSYVSP